MFEYMAAKSLIVAPGKPNIREILSDECAVLFEPGEPESFKQALLGALDNIAERNAMRERVYQQMWDKGFTWDENARRIVRMASNLIAEKATPVALGAPGR